LARRSRKSTETLFGQLQTAQGIGEKIITQFLHGASGDYARIISEVAGTRKLIPRFERREFKPKGERV
jgi:hypothetical protein